MRRWGCGSVPADSSVRTGRDGRTDERHGQTDGTDGTHGTKIRTDGRDGAGRTDGTGLHAPTAPTRKGQQDVLVLTVQLLVWVIAKWFVCVFVCPHVT